jgi:DNA-binding GntR family transcriptional regulator
MVKKNILPFGVYERLCEEILSGRIPPGANLREEQIAEDMGVSRTPVREALRKLAEEGLVEYFPHRGARLMKLEANRVREVFEIREVLEGLAARQATVRLTNEQLCELRARFEDLRPKVMAGDTSEVGDFLHSEIFANCGNERLTRLMSGIRNQVQWIQRAAIDVPGRLNRAFYEHEGILCALESGAPDWAESAMRGHIRNTMRDLIAQSGESL